MKRPDIQGTPPIWSLAMSVRRRIWGCIRCRSLRTRGGARRESRRSRPSRRGRRPRSASTLGSRRDYRCPDARWRRWWLPADEAAFMADSQIGPTSSHGTQRAARDRAKRGAGISSADAARDRAAGRAVGREALGCPPAWTRGFFAAWNDERAERPVRDEGPEHLAVFR